MILEKNKIVQIISPMSSKDDIESKMINMKNSLGAVIIVNLAQSVGHSTEIAITQGKGEEGHGKKELERAVRVWAIEDVESDTINKKDMKSYTVTDDIKKKQIVFKVDPTSLDINEGYDSIGIKIKGSSQEENLVSANMIFLNKYSD